MIDPYRITILFVRTASVVPSSFAVITHRRVRRRDRAHCSSDDAKASSVSWLMPQVDVEATGLVALGNQGAVSVEVVVVVTVIISIFNTLRLMAIIEAMISNT